MVTNNSTSKITAQDMSLSSYFLIPDSSLQEVARFLLAKVKKARCKNEAGGTIFFNFAASQNQNPAVYIDVNKIHILKLI
ncbi:hypothetical protein [Flavobacterium sp. BFFFF1]|uniref:hypothetical protein n=1 Tax=Flavobacterium sp. BFFFF1 TaxID=2015557 RepID=UPI0025C17416|nr:hypothetical protein [Flavobacterium sp. BFFFF1]